jgi:hypothetical protein
MDFHSPAEKATKKTTEISTLFVELKKTLTAHLDAVRKQRENHPASKPYHITEQMIKNLDESFEAIREEAERFDYTIFSTSAVKVGELLKKLRTPVQYRRADIFNELSEVLETIEQTLKEKLRTT